jgi:signal transduction histidine kinase
MYNNTGRVVRGLLLLLLIFTNRLPVNAQSGSYEMTAHYNSENGLPQNTINGFGFSEDGFAWIATENCLVRFEGNACKTVSDFGIEKIGFFQNKLLAKIQGASAVLEIKDGYAEEKTTIQGLRITRAGNKFYQPGSQYGYAIMKAIEENRLLTVNERGDEGYFIGTDKRLMYYRQSTCRPTGVSALPSTDFFVLKSGLYVFDQGRGLGAIYNGRYQKKLKGTLPALIKTMSSREKENSSFRQTDTSVFFYYNSNVYLITEQAPGVLNAELLTDKAGMGYKTNFLYLPQHNMLLIGTGDDGFYLYRKKKFTTITYPTAQTVVKGSNVSTIGTNSYIPSVQVLNDSLLLNNFGKLSITGAVYPVSKDVEISEWCVPRTTNGYILHLNWSLNKIIVRDTNLKKLGELEGISEDMGSYCNEGDTTYLAFRNGHILKLLLGKKGPFVKLGELIVSRKEKGRIFIFKLTADTLLVASRTTIHLLNISTGKSRVLLSKPKYFDIRAVSMDNEGTVWIGTLGQGWYKYKAGQEMIKMPIDHNANLTNIVAFAEDKKGFMWIATTNGLFRFYKKDLGGLTDYRDALCYYNYFTKEDGFLSNEFNADLMNLPVMLNDGRIIFRNAIGLVMVDPLKVSEGKHSFNIQVSNILIDGKKAAGNEEIILKPSFNTISFDVAIPYYGQHYNLQIEYRLSGGASNWTSINDNGRINFNRLEFGEYALTIRMLKGFDSGDYIYITIYFSVKPRWYQTWWFYGVMLLAMNVLMAMYFRIRNRNIQRQKQMLEKEVTRRTEDLKQSEEKVKQNARFKSQITSLVLHDVRSPLFYLSKITGSIYKASECGISEFFRDQLKDLHLSVKEVSEYAQNLFAWVNAQQDDFVMKSTPVKLRDLFEEIAGNYYLLAAQNQNTIGLKAEDSLIVVVQADLLQIVLRNMVDNAIKYTQGGRIMLSAEQRGNRVYILVWDTGRGMTSEKIERIMDENGNYAGDTRSGMGFRYIKDLLKKMDAKLEIKSEEGVGSAVTIILSTNNPIV